MKAGDPHRIEVLQTAQTLPYMQQDEQVFGLLNSFEAAFTDLCFSLNSNGASGNDTMIFCRLSTVDELMAFFPLQSLMTD